MSELIIIRGLPGSGKSTLAASMTGYAHVEADMFFVGTDGVYRFDPDRIGAAHQWCQRTVANLLSSGRKVVVSNTFTRAWEMKPYFGMGVPVRVVTCDGRWQNIHGVPDDVIARMNDRWEPVEMVDYV